MAWMSVAQCEACWIEQNTAYDDDGEPMIRIPVRVVDSSLETCNDCGKITIMGIFVRAEVPHAQKQFYQMMHGE